MWDLRILGPVELFAGERRLDLGPAKQRAVLAALAVDTGQTVPIEVLIDRVWDETPPRTVRNALHTYVLRLRRLLETLDDTGVRLEFRNGGYALRADPERVDLFRFRRLIRRTRGGAEQLREALGLWHGQPLAGLRGEWAAQLRDDLEQQRLSATLTLAPLELDLGTPPGTVVDLLKPMLEAHPLVEPLAAVLIRALRADGRPSEALAWYRRTRDRLHDELGALPGPELEAAHQATPPPARPANAPRQLPLDVRGFTGREAELSRLDDLLEEGDGLVVAAVSGTAGVGKTTLAVHWAHGVRDRFPDGQLYVNLRGFDPDGPPAAAAEALRGFLDALGVPSQRIPADVPAQSALFRSRLTGKRMLILLDNAADAAQVRPLLPAEPGCLALVTSRASLSGLVATEGARPLRLDTMPGTDGRALLARRVGDRRIKDEPEAVDRILTACAGLPLALAITAARAATHPHFSLGTVAAELDDARHRLDALADADPATDVRAVFSWSYRTLDPATARLFRLLGLHPGPDASLGAVASLAGQTAAEVRPLLTRLIQANLLVEQPAGRYGCHDLLRAYARELTDRDDAEEERRAATRRVLDFYLHTALIGDRRLYPNRTKRHFAPDPLVGGVTPEPLADLAAAQTWFAREERVLRAAVDLAAATGHDKHAFLLPWALATYFEREWNERDWIACLNIAHQAAERSGDRYRRARTHYSLGYAHRELGRPSEAYEHLVKALDLLGDDDTTGENAIVLLNLGTTARRLGRHDEALEQGRRAMEIYRTHGDRPGEASALNNIGWVHVVLGNYAEALEHCRLAVKIQEEEGNWTGAAHSWDSVGYVHHHLGNYAEAVTCYHRSRDLFRDQGDRRLEAIILTHLGDTHLAAGDPPAARDAWRQALDIYEEIDHTDSEEVRAKLRDDLARVHP
ncbi:AfsR/SARP family transcriptional regulator [Actinoplanes friuliensis]|uniref:SARP family transcriptional regulator n=1 Tax=Actinoplanes friuliensis DSM 7358 TaxID=1246995 RepID=U5VRR4_9ACTN|nr:tetratricopeptide repeat protein [Actinoplanes friuliensis]AGZ39643.1 SARP family transcriptional regulator [Actinoplanes friuliensis DSM 7358]